MIMLLAATLLLAAPSHASDLALSTRLEIPLKAPPGWKETKEQGGWILVPGDLPEGKMYTVVVTPFEGKAGTLDEVYATGKKLLAETGTYTAMISPPPQQSEGGWDYRFSIGGLERDGKGLYTELLALKKGDEGAVVVVLSESVETMQRYAEPFSAMIRSLGGTGKPPPAPTVAEGSGVVDLKYSVPPNWVETKKAGVSLLEASKDDFYTKYRWTLVVMPSQPMKVSLSEHFREYWSALVSANYDSTVVPLPLLARREDGSVCAFDADDRAKHKVNGSQPHMVAVYLIAQGNRFVPILAVLHGYDKPLDLALNQFLETAKIGSASPARIALFKKAELAGEWSEGSSVLANYVTASGAYAGDASLFTGSYVNLNSDGGFRRTFIAISSSRRMKETEDGTWSLDDNELVLKLKNGTNRYSILGYGIDPKAGRFLVLGTYANQKSKLNYANPRGPFQASWYKAK